MFYHGTSSNCNISNMLIPPVDSKFLSEEGRNKNLDKVFFTKDKGLAKVYAGRTCNRVGGSKKLYRVIPMGDVVVLSDKLGASVYYCDWAFVEEIFS